VSDKGEQGTPGIVQSVERAEQKIQCLRQWLVRLGGGFGEQGIPAFGNQQAGLFDKLETRWQSGFEGKALQQLLAEAVKGRRPQTLFTAQRGFEKLARLLAQPGCR